MSDGRATTLLGALAIALCPLVCLGLPLLLAGGIGAGLALAIGGAVLGGVLLSGLAGGAFLLLRRSRAPERCCEPVEHVEAEERSGAGSPERDPPMPETPKEEAT